MIESVFFDLDGTLKINIPSGMDFFLRHARELGISIDACKIQDGTRWNHRYWAQSPSLAEDLALNDDFAFWIRYSYRLLRAVGVEEVDDPFAEIITRRFADYTPLTQLNKGAIQTLVELKSTGYLLGLVSNRTKPLDGAIRDLGLTGFFQCALAAGEIGIWKPDPGILNEAMKRCGSSPETAIYVGDNYYADVVSAREAGMIPVLLDPDGVFTNTDCKVIQCLTELIDWLT